MPRPHRRSIGGFILPLVAVAMFAGACSSSTSTDDAGQDDAAESDGTETTDSDDTAAETTAAETTVAEATLRASVQGVPDSAAGRQFEKLLVGALEGSLIEAEVESVLSPLFLEQVSAASFIAMSGQLLDLLGASPVISQISVDTDPALAGMLVNPDDGSSFGFLISVEVNEPHRVLGYTIVPDPGAPTDDSITDLTAALEAWSAFAPRSELLIAEVEAGADNCEAPLATTGAGEALAIGSAFKFYVLSAVASAVDAGDVAWSDEVTIVEGVRSFPSGQLQLEDPGTTLSVATTAELMMGISDNTATDILIDFVGRDAVEAELAKAGHHRPSLNRPFLTTRELFQLKLGDPIQLGLYGSGTEEQRREILNGLTSEPLPNVAPESFTEPTALEVEWLATIEDLCRVIVSLSERADGQPDLETALTAGRGSLDQRTWPQAAFKGGSEPGVLSLTWLASRADGRTFVVSGILNDPDTNVAQQQADALALRIFDLLAELG